MTRQTLAAQLRRWVKRAGQSGGWYSELVDFIGCTFPDKRSETVTSSETLLLLSSL